ncbi:MAG: acetylxylan esterase [Bacteroidota bacterium]
MKELLSFSLFAFGMFPVCAMLVQNQTIAQNNPAGQYDESKVPQYTLPDPLILLNGEKVTDTATWNGKRRPEILKMFETDVYGKASVNRPEHIHWEITAEDHNALNGLAHMKKVTIYFSDKKDGPKLEVEIILPKVEKPVPVFLVSTWGPDAELVINKGFGLVTFDAREIEPDNKDSAYANGIRKFFDPPNRKEPTPDEWGTIAAWSWAARRVMDYIETDTNIDARKVCILGFSRFGKAAMWAGAQDRRFAIVFSCESGCGGATIVRRGFGETVKLINDQFPHWFDGNFKSFNSRVNDLPLDWHMLIALMAPRPVYVSTAEEDLWGDPRGTFLAAKAAEPVYELFGESGLGVTEMPPVETPVGNFIGYHMRKGKHGLIDYDTEKFIDFARRHFSTIGVHDIR